MNQLENIVKDNSPTQDPDDPYTSTVTHSRAPPPQNTEISPRNSAVSLSQSSVNSPTTANMTNQDNYLPSPNVLLTAHSLLTIPNVHFFTYLQYTHSFMF